LATTARLRLRRLEDRSVPAAFTVNAITDTGAGAGLIGDLRYCITQANDEINFPGEDTITFDAGVFGSAKTIVLNGTELKISSQMVITGPAAQLTIDANNASRIFNVDDTTGTTAFTLSNVTLTKGNATGNGGAVRSLDEALTFTNVVVTGNKASTSGGGISIDSGTGSLTLTDCVVSNNTASGDDGGGINFDVSGSPTLSMSRTTVSGNTAAADGGGIYFFLGGTATITDSTLSGNSATTDDGGGAYLWDVSATFTNTTISGNTAGDSGGGLVLFSSSTVTLNNCTVTGNTAKGSNGGGGVYLYTYYAYGSTLTLDSTIIAKNNSAVSPDIDGDVTAGYSLIGDNTGIGTLTDLGFNLIGVDPLLTPLAFRGGPTQTHTLNAGSPALNAGNNALALANDQRGAGFPRVVGSQADIGATEGVEVNPSALLTPIPPIVTPGPTPNTVVVTYADNVAINVGTIDVNDITITAPDGITKLPITAVAVDINTNGSPRVATYTFTVPGGSWNAPDNGVYTVAMVAGQVLDTDGPNAVLGGTLGTFLVGLPASYLVDNLSDVSDGKYGVGELTLREAIELSNLSAGSADVINFDAGVFKAGSTIAVGSEMKITDPVVINGPGIGNLTLDGGASKRIFNIDAPGSGNAIDISGMTLANGGATGGATLLNADEAVTLSKVVVTGAKNSPAVWLNAANATLTATDSTFSNNSSGGTGGGAIRVQPSATGLAVTLVRCTLSGNTSVSGSGGAVYFNFGGTFTVTDTTFSGNTGGTGGAVAMWNAVATFTNTTFANNTGTTGGAVALQSTGAAATFDNSTISGNTATGGNGGGIARTSSGAGTVTLNSTIVAKNTGTNAPDIWSTAASATLGDNNLIGVADKIGSFTLGGAANKTGTSATPLDPLLTALGNYGGPTQTMVLQKGSPALDVGSNGLGLTNDQRGAGFPRVVNGTADIGATEGIYNLPVATLVPLGPITTIAPTPNTVQVTYTDDTGINVSTIDVNDITITAPNGITKLPITGVTVDVGSNGTPRTATYTFTVPGGGWESSDNGNYTVAMVGGQVFDTDGVPQSVPAGGLGTFKVSIGALFVVNATNDEAVDTDSKTSLREAVLAANSDGTTNDTISFDPTVFATAQTITVSGLGTLAITGPVIISGTGADKLTVSGGGAARVFSVNNGVTGQIAVTFSGMTITGGAGTGNGGGIQAGDENVTLDGVALRGNTATGAGGGISLGSGSALTILNSEVSGNTAAVTGGGGAYTGGVAAVVIRNSTFSGNTVTSGIGGGFCGFSWSASGSFTMTNSTFTLNSSGTGNGGAIRVTVGGAALNIESSVISGNTGSTTAPEIYAGTVNLVNSLVGSNKGFTLGTNTGNLPEGTDPVLNALANNGGPTQTHLPGPGSPLRDAGSNPASLAFDQRGAGFPRVLLGTADIGAVESITAIPAAKFVTQPPITTIGATPNTVQVIYTDETAINVSSIDINDITITGPGGAVAITGVTVDINTNGSPRTATYTFTVPGGGWDQADNGSYTVAVVAGQVFDTDGPNAVTAGTIGKFVVAIPVEYVVDEATDVDDLDYSVGKLSIREAISLANTDGVPSKITFKGSAFPSGTVVGLASGEMAISAPVEIIGPGLNNLKLDGLATSRVFNIDVTGSSANAVTISAMTLFNGSAAGNGGAILNADEALSLTDVAVTGSTATGDGGGISVSSSTGSLSLTRVSVTGNTVSGTYSNGGGINLGSSSTVTIVSSTISNNTASEDGGGLYFFNGGALSLIRSTISGNKSNTVSPGVGGGGIYFFGTATTFLVQNSTVSGNSAFLDNGGTYSPYGYGGGILLNAFSGNAVIQNSTIVFNDSGRGGGGFAQAGGTTKIESSIISGNTQGGLNTPLADLFFYGPTVVAGDNNLIGINDALTLATFGPATQQGSLATPLDAKIDPVLALNGAPAGSPLTHALLVGSPAIDQGNNVAGLASDQRGAVRTFDDPGVTNGPGGATDVGAFEFGAAFAAPPTVTNVAVNGAGSQRSMVTSIVVTFSEAVTFPSGINAAFTLNRIANPSGGPSAGAPLGSVNINAVQSGNQVTITFAGGGAVPIDLAGSLIDGAYQLIIDASKVTGIGGSLDGDGNGTGGDNYQTPTVGAGRIHRLFGDNDGDGDVDAIDFGQFRAAFGGSNVAFDFDGDADVDAVDFGQFRARFGSSV